MDLNTTDPSTTLGCFMLVNASSSQKAVFSVLAVSLFFNLAVLVWLAKGHWDRSGRIADHEIEFPLKDIETTDLEKCVADECPPQSEHAPRLESIAKDVDLEQRLRPYKDRVNAIPRKPPAKSRIPDDGSDDNDIPRRPPTRSRLPNDKLDEKNPSDDIKTGPQRPPPTAKRGVKFGESEDNDSTRATRDGILDRKATRDKARSTRTPGKPSKSILKDLKTNGSDEPKYQAYKRPSYAPSAESGSRISLDFDYDDDLPRR